MARQTALTTKPLPASARKALVAGVAKTATGKAKAGIGLIDFRPPLASERAVAELLTGAARRALARSTRKT